MKKQVMIVPWISLSFLLYGTLWAFCSEFSYKEKWKPEIWLVILIAGVVTLTVLQLKKGVAITATMVMFAGCGLFVVCNLPRLKSDLQTILFYINQRSLKYSNKIFLEFGLDKKGDTDGSILLLLIGFCMVVYIAIVAFLLHRRFLGLAICFLSCFGMFFGKTPDVRAVMCIFFGGLLAAGWISYQEDSRGDFLKREKNQELNERFAAGALLGVLLVLALACGSYIGQKTKTRILSHSENALNVHHKIERTAIRKVQEAAQFIRGQLALDSEGRLSNTEPYYTGKTVMEVTLRSKPKEDVYLRGFVGENYRSGKWSETDGQAFQKIFSDLESQEMINSISYKAYDSLKDYINLYMYDIETDAVNSHAFITTISDEETNTGTSNVVRQQVKIDYTGFGKMSKYAYVPYFSDVQRVRNEAGDSCLQMNADNGILKKENTLLVSNYLFGMEQIQYFCKEMYNALGSEWYMSDIPSDSLNDYIEYAQKVYLQMPKRGLEEFKTFAASYDITRCRNTDQSVYSDNGKKRIMQVVEDVQNILGDTAVYSKQLGNIPMSEDYVEHFLLTEKAGYCEHFATAGTLLLREYGVPARYVSGYRVPARAFHKNEDGSYTAQVFDYDAHAWSEFLYSTLGWIPVEMTPASGNNVEQYNPPATVKPTKKPTDRTENVSNSEKTEAEKASEKMNAINKSTATVKPKSTDEAVDKLKKKPTSITNEDVMKVIYSVTGMVLVFAVVIVVGYVLRARFKRRKELELLCRLQDYNSLYALEKISQLHRFMRGCRVCKAEALSDEDWILAVSEYCRMPEWNEEGEKVCKILKKAAFSKYDISIEEREMVCDFTTNVERCIYQKQNKWNKCYLQALGWKKEQ